MRYLRHTRFEKAGGEGSGEREAGGWRFRRSRPLLSVSNASSFVWGVFGTFLFTIQQL